MTAPTASASEQMQEAEMSRCPHAWEPRFQQSMEDGEIRWRECKFCGKTEHDGCGVAHRQNEQSNNDAGGGHRTPHTPQPEQHPSAAPASPSQPTSPQAQWKRVPREPTETMERAGFIAWRRFDDGTSPTEMVAEIWQSMYDAAPPAAGQEETMQGIRALIRAWHSKDADSIEVCQRIARLLARADAQEPK